MTPDDPLLDLPALLRAAWEGRQELRSDPSQTAYRLFHGYGEGCPGLSIDRLGEALIVTHVPELEPHLARVLEALEPLGLPRYVVSKLRRGRAEPRLLLGEALPQELEVLDSGLRFAVEPTARRNPGLYLDARPARRWLLENSRERRVLNLFAFTVSLGVAALSFLVGLLVRIFFNIDG